MTYTAKVFNVMIASPGDVASERSIVREVISEWNSVHSASRNIVLMPIGWESHSSPEMGGTAQEIINHQVLGKSDFLVGVFWTRIGTETDGFASGTVEEIEKHVKSGKPAMLYFSSQPVAMDTVDLEQIEKLKQFKESCKNRSLYEGYDNHADFKEKFYRHLQLKLNEHELFKDINAEEIADPVESTTKIPPLSMEARTILHEASIDANGNILSVRSLGGRTIQVGGKNLITSNERREVAKWEAALKELIYQNLVSGIGHKGEIFEVTNLGYQVADMIKL